jgi:hypothetical protein
MALKSGMNTRDLQKLQASINRLRTKLPEAGTDVLEDAARSHATKAASAVMSRPGSSGNYKREPEAYDWTANRGGDPAVSIDRGGTAVAAEFGATYHTVFGKRVAQKSMKRRVFGARVKRALSGKVVGKTIKQDLPSMERDLAVAFDRTAEAEFRKAGL